MHRTLRLLIHTSHRQFSHTFLTQSHVLSLSLPLDRSDRQASMHAHTHKSAYHGMQVQSSSG
uniref:Uncharacterized protein n=1 Tax=Anguilla anguilla TaxID=7936 RepID=A0A0E9W5W8_ANGAN